MADKQPPAIPRIHVPLDEEDPRYAMSFTLDQVEEILNFFAEYGFVVIRDVVSPEDCNRSVDELWGLLEAGGEMKRNDPETWSNWPKNGIEQYGQPSRPPIFTPQFMRNRQNPNIHRAFSILFGETDLLVNIDRGCVFRATKQVPFKDGVRDVPQWATKPNLHLDMNPWQWLADDDSAHDELEKLTYDKPGHFIQENNRVDRKDGLTLQAVLNLLDNKEADGGYQCVPGFHKVFERYFTTVPGSKEPSSYVFLPKDPVCKLGVRIPMRQGSLVLWDQRMPHGSLPTCSSNFRCAQFLRMFPASKVGAARATARANAIMKQIISLGSSFQVTELGYQLIVMMKNLNVPEGMVGYKVLGSARYMLQ